MRHRKLYLKHVVGKIGGCSKWGSGPLSLSFYNTKHASNILIDWPNMNVATFLGAFSQNGKNGCKRSNVTNFMRFILFSWHRHQHQSKEGEARRGEGRGRFGWLNEVQRTVVSISPAARIISICQGY